MQSGRLLASDLLVNPRVYSVECNIFLDDGSDKTYGFISKQLLDQTELCQAHGSTRASFLCSLTKGFSPSKEKLKCNYGHSQTHLGRFKEPPGLQAEEI